MNADEGDFVSGERNLPPRGETESFYSERGVTLTDRISWPSKWVLSALFLASAFIARSAAADVTLTEHDGWEVFLNGRIQTFANYNQGNGRPANGSTSTFVDNNMKTVEVRGGGVERYTGVLPEYSNPGNEATATDQGTVQEMRVRSGFTGNVLGFGIRKKISEATEFLGYTAVTVGIDSEQRRKFSPVNPDWRESFLRVTSSWGSLTAGRALTLFSRGATEITYLYGYRYGLGFPGTITNFSQSTAGSVGFGVLGNGFGAGLAYATPRMGGLQVTVGMYDATTLPNTPLLNRAKWPRGEGEATFERKFGSTGFLKLFVNGAFQRLHDLEGSPLYADAYGSGFGGRLEIGPVKFGLAGHYGKGVGVTYSLEPHYSVYFIERTREALDDQTSTCGMSGGQRGCPAVKMRTVDGGYAQAQVAVTKAIDVRAGAGVTRVHQLPEDRDASWKLVNAGGITDSSVGYVTIRQQVGIGAGLTIHAAENLHVTIEYFRAMFQWYRPVPAVPGSPYPSQTLNFVNTGVTYDF